MSTILKNLRIKNSSIGGFLSPMDLNPAAAFIENNAVYLRASDGTRTHEQTDDVGTIGIPETYVSGAYKRQIVHTSAFNLSSYSSFSDILHKNYALSNSAYNFLHNGTGGAFIVIFKLASPEILQLDGIFSTARVGVVGAGAGLFMNAFSPTRNLQFFIQNDTTIIFSQSFIPNDVSKFMVIGGLLSNNIRIFDGVDKKLDANISGQSLGNAVSNLQIWGMTGISNLNGWGRALYLYDYVPDETLFLNVLSGLKQNSLGD